VITQIAGQKSYSLPPEAGNRVHSMMPPTTYCVQQSVGPHAVHLTIVRIAGLLVGNTALYALAQRKLVQFLPILPILSQKHRQTQPPASYAKSPIPCPLPTLNRA